MTATHISDPLGGAVEDIYHDNRRVHDHLQGDGILRCNVDECYRQGQLVADISKLISNTKTNMETFVGVLRIDSIQKNCFKRIEIFNFFIHTFVA